MGDADWRLLEEFTEAAAGATEMLKEQRGALEVRAHYPGSVVVATHCGAATEHTHAAAPLTPPPGDHSCRRVKTGGWGVATTRPC